MPARMSGPPTNARFQQGIREGPSSTSTRAQDKDSEIERAREPVVIMRAGDGGVDVLAEDRTYTLGAGPLRDLLFYGNRVRLAGDGTEPALAWPGFDRRWICFGLGRALYLLPRSRLVRVARGEVPADRLVLVGAL